MVLGYPFSLGLLEPNACVCVITAQNCLRLKTTVVYISFLLCEGHWPVRDGIYDPKSLEYRFPPCEALIQFEAQNQTLHIVSDLGNGPTQFSSSLGISSTNIL